MSATSTRTSQQELPTGRRRVSLGLLGARFAVVGVWLALIAVYGALSPDTFLTTGTFQTIFGSQLALVFLSAALVGAVNGLLIVRLGVNTIVITLGMGTLLLGVALWLTNLTATSGLPREFGEISLYRVAGLPVGFYWGLFLMLAFGYLLAFTPLGRNMRFVGANREVSRLAGVRVNRIRFGAFVAAGVICGIGGVLAAAAVGGFDPTTSQSYLLPTFAATFLGTAILQPGLFNPLGTLIAVFFLATGILGLNLLGFTGWVTSVFYGGVLVVAVTVSSLLHRRAG